MDAVLSKPSEVAYKYLTLGRSVIPTGAGDDGKKPSTPGQLWKAYQHRLPFEDEFLTWAESSPASWAMVGGNVSNITVVDCDTDKAVAIMEGEGLKRHVTTPRGGAHFYFEYFKVAVPSNERTIDGVKVEVRGNGTYSNFTGTTPKGSYTTHEIALEGPGSLHHLSDVGLELQRVLQGTTEAKGKTKTPKKTLKEGPITEGQRNDYLASVAGSIRHLVTHEEGRAILMALNNTKCSPPLDFKEVMRIADSVARYGYREEHHVSIPESYLEAMSRLPVRPSAHRVLLFIVRKTVGFGKVRDTIARSQLEAATGILGPHVSRAIKELEAANVIEVARHGTGPIRGISSYAVLHPEHWKLN